MTYKKTTRNKKLLRAPGLTTRSTDTTRGSWHCYQQQEAYRALHRRPVGRRISYSGRFATITAPTSCFERHRGHSLEVVDILRCSFRYQKLENSVERDLSTVEQELKEDCIQAMIQFQPPTITVVSEQMAQTPTCRLDGGRYQPCLGDCAMYSETVVFCFSHP